ncbi:MAG: hypothetical protein ACYCU7_12105 [Acidimicrobiales bacterium]
MLAVVATSLLRRHLGYRAWRAAHLATWVFWPPALFHSLGSGTDAHTPSDIGVAAVCLATVRAAGIWRLWLADEADGGDGGGEPVRVDRVPSRRVTAPLPVPVPVPVERVGTAGRVTGGGRR